MKALFQLTTAMALILGSISIQSGYAATNIGVRGGLSLLTGDAYSGKSSIGALMGGEVTFGIGDGFDIGGVGQFSTNASLAYFGALLRSEISGTGGVFGDLELGMSATSNTSHFAMGLGLGSKMEIAESLELLPRVGVRYLPQAGNSGFGFDLMVLLNFALGPKT